MSHQSPHKRLGGQALVEFALILPVVLLLIFGIIDFSRIFVAYATSSGSLREAVRYAATVGYDNTARFRNCDEIRAEAAKAFFLTTQEIIIEYIDTDTMVATLCPVGTAEYTGDLENGDILQITTNNTITPWTPLIAQIFPELSVSFVARRTIIEEIQIGSTSSTSDTDADGLDDVWEIEHFGNLDQIATDDPDNDGCNNGCEEVKSTDPNDPDTDGDGYLDGVEIFDLGTDPLDPSDPGSSVMAVDDNATTEKDRSIAIDVLENDYGDALTIEIVSGSSWSSTFNGTVTLNNNGTTDDTADDYLVYTPPAGVQGTDTFTYTITDYSAVTDTGTVTITITAPAPTPAPSATPENIDHTSSAFVDTITTSNTDYWRFNHGKVFLGSDDWDVEYWSGSLSSTGDAETLLGTAATCTGSLDFDEPIAFDWDSGGPSECSVGSDGFAVRWSRSFGYGVSGGADLNVTLTTIANDGIRVYINESTGTKTEITALTTWTTNGSGTPVSKSTSYTFHPGVMYDIVVEYFETSGSNAVAAFLVDDGLTQDVGICNWSQSTEDVASALYALTDSPGTNYSANSTCYLELRGTVDLSPMGTNPTMTFWDKWDLAVTDLARLEVRQSSGTWFSQTLHTGLDAQTVWQKETINLNNFAGQNFTGQIVEFRFVLESDATANENGWWIDNITIKDNDNTTYTMPPEPNVVDDDVESINEYWTTDWTVVSSPAREGYGAWSAPTVNGSSTMQLNGEFIMPSDNGQYPELTFYHQYSLGASETIYVEFASSEDFSTILDSIALATNSSVASFEKVSIPLDSYWGTSFYLRFRIASNGSGGDWYVDNIKIDYRDTTTLEYPFYDNMNYSPSDYSEVINERWIVNDDWAISAENTRNNSLGAWSDSIGANYVDGSNSSFQTAYEIDMSSAVDPELSFWHKRDLAAEDDFIVEVSTDYGDSWSTVWSYEYSTAYSSAPETSADQFNTQMAWERVVVDMDTYVGQLIMLRFRLDARTDSSTGGGVWIEDILLDEHTESLYEEDDGDGKAFYSGMSSLTTSDYDPDGSNPHPTWHIGGNWGITTGHHGNAITDSVSGDYTTNTWSVLELADPILVPEIDEDEFPVLSWWGKVALANGDYARVQVSEWDGSAWGGWTNVQSSSSPSTEVLPHDYLTGHSWDFRQVDMSDYEGATIRLRFVVDALHDSSSPDTDDGWIIDEVRLELYDPDVISVNLFSENGTSEDNWIEEGTWDVEEVTRTFPGGTVSLPSGTWTAEFFDLDQFSSCYTITGWSGWNPITQDVALEDLALFAIEGTVFEGGGNYWSPWGYQGDCQNETFDVIDTATMNRINFECSTADAINPNGLCSSEAWSDGDTHIDNIAIRFTGTIDVPSATNYDMYFTLHDDGLKVFLNGSSTAAIDEWYYSYSNTSLLEFTGGYSYDIEIYYYEGTWLSGLNMVLESDSYVAASETYHESIDDDEYLIYDNMALQLDGTISLTGIEDPILSWADSFDMGDAACIYPEISLPYEEFDNWISVADSSYVEPDYDNDGCVGDTTVDWTTREVDLEAFLNSEFGITSLPGVEIAVRFRLDARSATETDNGWWIDDITIEGYEIADTDGDGIDDVDEIYGTYGYYTDPTNSDTDGDGLTDGEEITVYLTNPLKTDTDNDYLSDSEEVTIGNDGYVTNPVDADTDDDLMSDYQETYVSPFWSTSPTSTDSKVAGKLDDNDDPLYTLVELYVANGLDMDAAVANTVGLTLDSDGRILIEFQTKKNNYDLPKNVMDQYGFDYTSYNGYNSGSGWNTYGYGSFYLDPDDLQEFLWRSYSYSNIYSYWEG